MPHCYRKALIHTTSLSFLIFIGSQRACWILSLFVWIHSLVNYVYWAMMCTWTFCLSRFFNIQISCATPARTATDLSEMWFFYLYAFVFLGAIASVERKYRRARMKEKKAKHRTSPCEVLLTIPLLWSQGSCSRDLGHIMVTIWVAAFTIFAVKLDKKCQRKTQVSRDLAGKFAAMLSASLVCCSGNLETETT